MATATAQGKSSVNGRECWVEKNAHTLQCENRIAMLTDTFVRCMNEFSFGIEFSGKLNLKNYLFCSPQRLHCSTVCVYSNCVHISGQIVFCVHFELIVVSSTNTACRMLLFIYLYHRCMFGIWFPCIGRTINAETTFDDLFREKKSFISE